MKGLIELIKETAPDDWDGEFMALDDHIKDQAVYCFLKFKVGSKHLEDIFPVCLEGAYERMIYELYHRPESFKVLYVEMIKGYETEERYISEACNSPTDALTNYNLLSDKKKRAYDLAEFWRKAAYHYCEDMLREACADYFSVLDNEGV